MIIIIVYEENHGTILCAKDYDAAKRALIETNWVYSGSDIWCPDLREEALMDAGDYRSIKDVYGDNWEEVFLSDLFDDTKLDLMGFHFRKEEVWE